MKVLFGRDGRDVGAAHIPRGGGSPMAQHVWQTVPAPTQLDELLLTIKGLIFARAILEQRGHSEVELEEHQGEIERLRWRPASLIGDGHADSDTAA
jgi:hypothetical protein